MTDLEFEREAVTFLHLVNLFDDKWEKRPTCPKMKWTAPQYSTADVYIMHGYAKEKGKIIVVPCPIYRDELENNRGGLSYTALVEAKLSACYISLGEYISRNIKK